MAHRVEEYDEKLRSESKRLVSRWYEGLVSEQNTERKVVYTSTSGSIAELFRTFDFRVVLPQMNAIQCGVKRVATEMIHHGEALGYSPDICGYMKNDLGLLAGPPEGVGPFGKIPRPDLLVVDSAGCFTTIKWFEALGRHFDCPVHVLDVPFLRDGALSTSERAYVHGQLTELIKVCENVSGKKYDADKLRSIIDLSYQTIELWNKLLDFGKLRPSPFDCFFEAISYMAPMTALRGTQECVDFYKATVMEIEDRVIRKDSPAGKERFRILFDGAPPWPKLKEFREMYRRWGGVGVVGTYTSFVCACGGKLTEYSDPLDALVDLSGSSFVNWNLAKRRQYIEDKAREFEVDGIVVHSVKSCRPFSIGQLDERNYLARDLGISTLFLDSDVIDPRYFSSAQIRNRIDTFFEILEQQIKSRTNNKRL
jgi:benzoyl-CoA reductase subunit B